MSGRMYFGNESGELLALDIKDGSTDLGDQARRLGQGGAGLRRRQPLRRRLRGQDERRRAPRTASIVWQTSDLGLGIAGSGRFYSTAAVAFGRVYAGDVDNRVYSFDADTGEIAWTFSAGDYVYSGIAAADTKGTGPTVYFGSHDRNVYAVDAKTRQGQVVGGTPAGRSAARPRSSATSSTSRPSAATRRSASTSAPAAASSATTTASTARSSPTASTLYLTGGVTVVAFEPIDRRQLQVQDEEGPEGHRPARTSSARRGRPPASGPASRQPRGRRRPGDGRAEEQSRAERSRPSRGETEPAAPKPRHTAVGIDAPERPNARARTRPDDWSTYRTSMPASRIARFASAIE